VALVGTGDAALTLAVLDGRVAGTGMWRRGPKPIFAHYADLQEVTAHPAARGRGVRPAGHRCADRRRHDVRMCLDLGRQPNVLLRGSTAGGPGSSPRRS
jgi:hypothetical protein